MGQHGGTGSLILSRKRFVYDKQQKRVVETEESKALRAAPGTQWRHHVSQSVSVLPKQAGRYRQFVKDMALPGVEINSDGRVHFESQHSQDRYVKALGYHNADR